MAAQGRWHMTSVDGAYMVEHHARELLVVIRQNDRRFARARIKHVLQCLPSTIRVGVVYEVGTTPPVRAAIQSLI
jgi:hypothetical protein